MNYVRDTPHIRFNSRNAFCVVIYNNVLFIPLQLLHQQTLHSNFKVVYNCTKCVDVFLCNVVDLNQCYEISKRDAVCLFLWRPSASEETKVAAVKSGRPKFPLRIFGTGKFTVFIDVKQQSVDLPADTKISKNFLYFADGITRHHTHGRIAPSCERMYR